MDMVSDTTAFEQSDVNRNTNFQEFDADMIESPLVSTTSDHPEVHLKLTGSCSRIVLDIKA